MKCPFCAEEIQDRAIKCKHCGEFLDGRNSHSSSPSLGDGIGKVFRSIGSLKKKADVALWGPSSYAVPSHNTPVKLLDITFYLTYFIHRSTRISYADICRLGYHASVQVINNVSSGKATLEIYTNNSNSPIILKRSSAIGFVTKKTFPVKNAYHIVRQLSAKSRWKYYIEELMSKGYIQYDHNIKIYKDGRLQCGNKCVDLKKAFLNDAIGIGTERKNFINNNRSTNPFKMMLSESGLGLFNSKIKFDCKYDLDILPDLLQIIVDGKLNN